MHTKLSLVAVLILAAAGGALFFAGGIPAQSRDAGPALNPGELAININASALIPGDPNLGAFMEITSKSSSKVYYAALQLPQGSTIKRIGFWGKDNDDGSWMVFSLYAQVNNTNNTNIVKTVKTSLLGASDTYQYWYSPRFSYTIKWNRSYILSLFMGDKSASAPNYMQFRYARVIYEPAP